MSATGRLFFGLALVLLLLLASSSSSGANARKVAYVSPDEEDTVTDEDPTPEREDNEAEDPNAEINRLDRLRKEAEDRIPQHETDPFAPGGHHHDAWWHLKHKARRHATVLHQDRGDEWRTFPDDDGKPEKGPMPDGGHPTHEESITRTHPDERKKRPEINHDRRDTHLHELFDKEMLKAYHEHVIPAQERFFKAHRVLSEHVEEHGEELAAAAADTPPLDTTDGGEGAANVSAVAAAKALAEKQRIRDKIHREIQKAAHEMEQAHRKVDLEHEYHREIRRHLDVIDEHVLDPHRHGTTEEHIESDDPEHPEGECRVERRSVEDLHSLVHHDADQFKLRREVHREHQERHNHDAMLEAQKMEALKADAAHQRMIEEEDARLRAAEL